MPDPSKMTPAQMTAYLRQSFDNEMHRMHSRLDLICEKWGIVQHVGSLSAYKLAEHWLDDWFPHGDRTAPLISEAEMHEFFAFADRFCRDYDFANVTKGRLESVSNIVLGGAKRVGDDIVHGEPFDIELAEGPAEEPEDWYRWVAIQLRLYDQPGWTKLDRDIRRLALTWGDDPDDDRDLATRLYSTVEAVQWGRRQTEAGA